MNSIFSLHSYWVINIAIALSYVLTRIILSIPFINKSLSRFQQLQLARKTFLGTFILLFLAPLIINKLPISQNHVFQFKPLLKHTSETLLSNTTFTAQLDKLQTPSSLPSVNDLFLMAMLMVVIYLATRHIIKILSLWRLTQKAYAYKKIKNIHIRLSETIHIPFCWSFLSSHFLILPLSMLEKNADLKLAIRHELQHLRQGDTHWLHFIAVMNLMCFWNPLMKYWSHWLNELQEFSCDEALILRNNTSRSSYAQCLLDTASHAFNDSPFPEGALGILGLSKQHSSILNRRVTMIFQYQKTKRKLGTLICVYSACFLTASTFAYALGSNSTGQPVTKKELITLIQKSHLNITATPEVMAEINNIRNSEQARTDMLLALERMEQYKPYIAEQLKNHAMPNQLLALPLVESGYQPLDESKNRVRAAGIWQFIPSTGRTYGLTINTTQDDRLNTQLSTKAAITFLKSLYAKYKDWNLAVIAYEYGDQITDQVIKDAGTRDAWTLARSPYAPKDLKKFLAMFDASVIIMNNKELITK